jgi:diphthamide synthase (EF-2-diphthine--ammonia ligase)
VQAIAFGDLFLEDTRRYREEKLAGTGIASLFPLWGIETGRLAREMIAGGLEAYVTCVDPRKLAASFAGRRFDLDLLADLSAGVDPCAENGEFHTFACAGPMFTRRSRSRPAKSSPVTPSCSVTSCPYKRTVVWVSDP